MDSAIYRHCLIQARSLFDKHASRFWIDRIRSMARRWAARVAKEPARQAYYRLQGYRRLRSLTRANAGDITCLSYALECAYAIKGPRRRRMLHDIVANTEAIGHKDYTGVDGRPYLSRIGQTVFTAHREKLNPYIDYTYNSRGVQHMRAGKARIPGEQTAVPECRIRNQLKAWLHKAQTRAHAPIPLQEFEALNEKIDRLQHRQIHPDIDLESPYRAVMRTRGAGLMDISGSRFDALTKFKGTISPGRLVANGNQLSPRFAMRRLQDISRRALVRDDSKIVWGIHMVQQ
ncbi:hypothetical protein CANCADRAFT_142120 [Tortispora caseinolytica NRRL Y-17796]|uniref:LYR motif-containing protein Cup1-like N-terminal domain-containing protein n=1 Tax=Tortispora caseinolytica NRRL Y-17796 TaxID=767744 RepID=A0A1E4TDF7_9ASCO|nr:hypothetical protein CANCADRAFT_142120 [Tortispora caseinolytica NRRL Y-17796]